MKKVISLITALILVFTFVAFPTEAEDAAESISVSIYPESTQTSYSPGATLDMSGSCESGVDIVLRIYDDNDSLVYTDVIYAYDNDGTFKFGEYVMPSVSETVYYTVKVSAGVYEYKGTLTIYKSGTGGGGGGGTTTTTNSVTWVDTTTEPGTTGETTTTPSAVEDPLKHEDLWKEVSKVETTAAAVSTIDTITKATSEEALGTEAARNNVATAVEAMVSNITSKKTTVSKSTNRLSLTESSISATELANVDTTMAALEKALDDNKITLNRGLSREFVLSVSFNGKKTATVSISKALIEKLDNAKIDVLTIKDTDFTISYTIAELKTMLGDKEEISFEINKSEITDTTKKLTVDFGESTTQTMKIAFNGLSSDTQYMAIVDENGNAVGGRYNPVTGVIEAKITESGVYQLVNNEKDFEDIKDKSAEMQESIKILASKGIIEGTSETEFSPDDEITRAEIAALLLRVLSQIDANADGGFDDVKNSDWFYGVAGSAKEYGMIQGYEDNTFRGNTVIAKDQILIIASRVLQKEMQYKVPSNLAEYLTFVDSDEISSWAKEDIAVATMANIITRSTDNAIHSKDNMTRGDAALIIMRLFYKVW